MGLSQVTQGGSQGASPQGPTVETLFSTRTRHIWCKRGETSSLPSRKAHLTVAMVQAPEHRALLLALF